MKLNKKFLFTSLAALFLLPAASLSNQEVQAKTQTLKLRSVESYESISPYIKSKGKFQQNYNKKLSTKNTYNVVGSSYDRGKKTYYTSYMDQFIINDVGYYYLGDGGYIKSNNASGQGKNTFRITHNSYVYDKNGKRLKSFRGGRAYLAKNTTVKSTAKQKYYYTPYTYYNIGKGQYVRNSDVNTLNGKGVLFVSQNSYVYNKKGKRANKTTIKAGSLVNYAGKTKSGKSQYYYQVGKKTKHITNHKIGGKYFFNIGKGKYIKANNVNTINGHALFTKGPITVTVTQDTNALNGKFQATNKIYKVGTKLTIDQAVWQGQSDYTMVYYHVKGTNYYVDSGLSTDYPDPSTGPYKWWEDGGPVIAKQYLEDENYNDLHYSFISFKKGATPTFYNFNGEKVSLKTDNYIAADQALYIYNPEAKKSELYYHLWKTIFVRASAEDDGIDTAVDNTYVKASDVDISGLKLTPTNTAEEAEEAAKTEATSNQLTKLKDSIADADSVKKSDKYILETWADRTVYDNAIENAQTVLKEKNPTSATVEQAQWLVDTAKKDLKGAKIKVKNINNLTGPEAQQIFELMNQRYAEGPGNYPFVGLYHKYAHKSGYYPTSAWDNNEKSVFFLFRSSGAKREKLNIADFATEK